MPKKVDHEERRGEIAAAVVRIAERKGLAGVSFREVAAEAGMSVALVQHYVATKENLLVHALNHTSATVANRIVSQVTALGDAGPFARLTTTLEAFLPRDDGSRAAMQVYLQFASAAMADPVLRSADAFANGHVLIDVLAAELADMAATGMMAAPDLDLRVEALALLSLVLGLSMGVLLEQTSPEQAQAALRAHLSRLRRPRDG